MPLNMGNALLELPDFARGEMPHPVKPSEFQPLFAGPSKVEMVSDVLFDTSIAEHPPSGPIPRPYENSAGSPLEIEQEIAVPRISLEEHQVIINDLKKRNEDELNGLRETHQNEVLRQLEMLETRLFEDISEQLESNVAQTLAPLAKTCISRNTLDALVKEIRSIAGREALNSLHISGPPVLTSAVKQKFSDDQLKVEIEETDDVELVVCLNDTLISTRLEEWIHKIETAIS